MQLAKSSILLFAILIQIGIPSSVYAGFPDDTVELYTEILNKIKVHENALSKRFSSPLECFNTLGNNLPTNIKKSINQALCETTVSWKYLSGTKGEYNFWRSTINMGVNSIEFGDFASTLFHESVHHRQWMKIFEGATTDLEKASKLLSYVEGLSKNQSHYGAWAIAFDNALNLSPAELDALRKDPKLTRAIEIYEGLDSKKKLELTAKGLDLSHELRAHLKDTKLAEQLSCPKARIGIRGKILEIFKSHKGPERMGRLIREVLPELAESYKSQTSSFAETILKIKEGEQTLGIGKKASLVASVNPDSCRTKTPPNPNCTQNSNCYNRLMVLQSFGGYAKTISDAAWNSNDLNGFAENCAHNIIPMLGVDAAQIAAMEAANRVAGSKAAQQIGGLLEATCARKLGKKAALACLKHANLAFLILETPSNLADIYHTAGEVCGLTGEAFFSYVWQDIIAPTPDAAAMMEQLAILNREYRVAEYLVAADYYIRQALNSQNSHEKRQLLRIAENFLSEANHHLYRYGLPLEPTMARRLELTLRALEDTLRANENCPTSDQPYPFPRPKALFPFSVSNSQPGFDSFGNQIFFPYQTFNGCPVGKDSLPKFSSKESSF